MVTTKGLLHEAGYALLHASMDTEDLWEDPAGHVMSFEDAVRFALNRCTCCGEPNLQAPVVSVQPASQ